MIVETITELFNSLIEYFSQINFKEVFDSAKMIVENLDTGLLKDTVNSVVELVQGLFN